MILEDKLLIRRYNRGNAEAIRRIYEKYKNDLTTLATALLYDKNLAEDVVHDVFTVFINSCGKLNLRENLKGYLVRCVVNKARDKNTAGQKQQSTPLDEIEPVALDANAPDWMAQLDEHKQKLTIALSRISWQQRVVLMLHLYSDLTFREIAKLENESINTIQGRYRYGLDKLRSMLNGEVKK